MPLRALILAYTNLYAVPRHENTPEATGIVAAITIGFVLVVAAAASVNRPGRRG